MNWRPPEIKQCACDCSRILCGKEFRFTMSSRAARGAPKAAAAQKHVDPMSYPDLTDFGHTEAHKALGRDRHSFMFEQVGGSGSG